LCHSHFLANIVHPKYRGKNLTDDEYGTGMDLAAKQHSAVIPDLVNYKAEAPPFQPFMFQQNVLESEATGVVEITVRPFESRIY